MPDILLSGDHEKVRLYNLKESLRLTKEKRPELYEQFMENNKENKDIKKLLKEEGGN